MADKYQKVLFYLNHELRGMYNLIGADCDYLHNYLNILREAIFKAKKYDKLQKQLKNGTLSDGYHTFNSLYRQRMILSATICNLIPDKCWKSKRHDDGELCFSGGWFIVGFDTSQGSYTYHYELKYWDLFKCKELEKGKKWDGHTDKDVERLLNLKEDE